MVETTTPCYLCDSPKAENEVVVEPNEDRHHATNTVVCDGCVNNPGVSQDG